MYAAIPLPGGREVPTYSLIFMVGYGLCLLISTQVARKEKSPWEPVLYSGLYAIIGILIGSKIMYAISKIPAIIAFWDDFVEVVKTDFLAALGFIGGGLVFYGGLFGALFGYWVYSKQFKVHLNFLFDYSVFLFPLVHAFGRVGCFFAGCCYGMEYHGPFAVQFPYNDITPELAEVTRFPVQLVEAGFNLILFLILLIVRTKRVLLPKALLGLYFVMYGVIRFCLEFLRGDKVRGGFILSTSQWVSLIVVPVGIYLLCKHRKNKNKPDKEENIKMQPNV